MRFHFRQGTRGTRRLAGSFRPQVMALEDRLPPGSLLSVGGLGLFTVLGADTAPGTVAADPSLTGSESLTLLAAASTQVPDGTSGDLGVTRVATGISSTEAGAAAVGMVTNTPLAVSFAVPADWLTTQPALNTTGSSALSQGVAAALDSSSSAPQVAAPVTGTGTPAATLPAAVNPAPQPVPVVPGNSLPATKSAATLSTTQAQQAMAHLALGFEANQGQYNAPIQFMTRAADYTFFLTPGEAVYGLWQPTGTDHPVPGETNGRHTPGTIRAMKDAPAATEQTALVHMQVLGGNLSAPAVGQQELPGKVNYYFGNDPNLWFTNIATFGQVAYPGVYPGIDLVYYGNQNRDVEYDFNVAPGANPEAINLGFSGAAMSLDDQGNLVLTTDVGQLVQHKPDAYQMINGARQEVAANFVIHDQNQVSFRLGAYDPTQPLVIDPGSQFSTYLGGSSIDRIFSIGADAAGNAYVTGHTQSTNFPTTAGAFQPRYHIGALFNSFVTKFDPTGTTLLYSTYLGGSIDDEAQSIAVDAAGNALVGGVANSADFPTTSGAFQTRLGGGGFATNEFLSKFNPTGGIIYSTYLGGSVDDEGFGTNGGPGVTMDAAGNAYISGYSASPDFPVTTTAYQSRLKPGAAQNAFLSKLSADGHTLLYSTYIGGSTNSFGGHGVDAGGGVGVVGNVAYVYGSTTADDFPTTPGAFQTTGPSGGTSSSPNFDLFVASIDTSLSGTASLLSSTYIGGAASDTESNNMRVDAQGDSFITGITVAPDYPVTPGAFQTTYNKMTAGSEDAFITEVAPDGSHLIFSSYYGGTMDSDGVGEQGSDVALDSLGNVYMSGSTSSFDLPLTPNAFQPVYHGGRDAFEAKISPNGSTLIYSTYFGGSALEAGLAIATFTDANGNIFAYAGGSTGSTDLFVSPGSYQTTYGGGARDGWLVRARSPM
jgi:beta-propeller repeat-containing protein